MPVTKQQRVYLAVLGLAAAAWMTDRFILHGGLTAPAGAQASSLLITHAQAIEPVSALAAQPAPVISLSERLDHFSAELAKSPEVMPDRDIFAPPASWLPEEKPAAASAVSSPLPQILADFRQAHPLTAVVRAGKKSQIFIGARIVRLGDSLDGFRLLSVTASSATFEYRGTMATLELADPRDSSSATIPLPRKAD